MDASQPLKKLINTDNIDGLTKIVRATDNPISSPKASSDIYNQKTLDNN